MALYRVTIPKQYISGAFVGFRGWRNVYTVEADTYESALAVGDVIAEQEMLFHHFTIGVTRVVAHLVTEPFRRVGRVFETERPGQYPSTAEALPDWNVVRVDYADVGVGRPERKYYRVGLHADMVTGLVLEPVFFSAVLDATGFINGLTNYVGPSGEQHASRTVQPLIAMRQRGWHRRQRPGFVRGYVPV